MITRLPHPVLQRVGLRPVWVYSYYSGPFCGAQTYLAAVIRPVGARRLRSVSLLDVRISGFRPRFESVRYGAKWADDELWESLVLSPLSKAEMWWALLRLAVRLVLR